MIVDPDLTKHRKTLKLAGRLQIPLGDAVLLLLHMWGHCQHRKTDLLGRDAEDVAACCQCLTIAPDTLTAALLDIGWIDETDDGYRAHGFRDRNSEWFRKIEGGKFSATRRRDGKGKLLPASSDASEDATQHPAQHAGKDAGPDVSEVALDSLGAEEKRREENRGGSRPPARTRTCEADIARSEHLLLAKKRMCRLLGLQPSRPWSPDAQQSLMALVPIPEDEWRAVEWLHAQPAGRQRPLLKSSPTSLCREWSDEVSKARALARDLDVTLWTPETPEGKKKDGPGHAHWPEWLAAQGFPAVDWDEADASLRREFRAFLASREKEEVPA